MSVHTDFEDYVDQLVDCGLGRGLALALAEQRFLLERSADPQQAFEIKHLATLARLRCGTTRIRRASYRLLAIWIVGYLVVSIAAHLIFPSK